MTQEPHKLEETFLHLFTQNHKRIRAYIFALLHNREGAEDVFQSTTLVLWRKFEQFNPEGDFLAWACGFAYALDARSGEKLWTYIAGGRVDSPPSIHGGMAIFGSTDGWVYSLRASDGELVWRFRAAPRERSIMAYGQVESAWPVHGSVLVANGVVHCTAGRSSFVDGGIYLYALDAATGHILDKSVIHEVQTVDRRSATQVADKTWSVRAQSAFLDFMRDTEITFYQRAKKFLVEELGARVPFTSTQANYQQPAILNAVADFADLHAYWHHPIFHGDAWSGSDWTVQNEPLVEFPFYNKWPPCNPMMRTVWRIHGTPFTFRIDRLISVVAGLARVRATLDSPEVLRLRLPGNATVISWPIPSWLNWIPILARATTWT